MINHLNLSLVRSKLAAGRFATTLEPLLVVQETLSHAPFHLVATVTEKSLLVTHNNHHVYLTLHQ